MYRNLEIEILRWAEARQIIPNSSTEKQLLKCVEELGELVGRPRLMALEMSW
jgi:hypothetical protein